MEESEIRRIAKDEARSAINAMLVGYGSVIIAFLVANMGMAGTIIYKLNRADDKVSQVATDAARQVLDVARDKYTVSMAVTAEWHRAKLNPGYVQVPIRQIQRDEHNADQ